MPSGPTQVNPSDRGVIPVGQEIDVRLQTALSSGRPPKEQRFETTSRSRPETGRQRADPAGSAVRGVVSNVAKAGNIDRTGNLSLAFDQIVINGREYKLRAMATEVFESARHP